MYMFTSIDAPRNRLVCIDLARPGRENWVDIVPEDAEGGVLTNVLFSGKDKLIAVFDRDASNHAYIFPLEGGKAIREVEFPTNTLSFCIFVPAWGQFSPYSAPPRRLAWAYMPPF